jgi:phosphonopyruvate decarboxylase
LDLLNIPFKILEPDETQVMQATEWAFKAALDNSSPTALLVKKGVLALKEKAGFLDVKQPYTVTREESINAILEAAPQNSCFVASTGRITRELFALRERHNESHDLDFLNVGAMGHALSIASGIASAQPSRPVICLDGDGAAIMHLGSLPITANLKQKNLLHVVLNNGVHESVGGQSTVGHKVSLTSVARDVGYNTIPAYVEDLGGLVGAVRSLISSNRCSFLEMRIKKGMREEMPILKMSPTDSKQRFMSAIKC